MTPDQVPDLLALVATYWPSWTMTEGQANATRTAWSRLLSDVPLDAAIAAVDALSCEGDRFAPPVGLIRKRAMQLSSPPIPDVDQAWAEVMHRAGPGGGFQMGSEGWSHPVIAAAVATIGWRRLCFDEHTPTLCAQFRDAYRPAAARAERDTALPASARALLDRRGSAVRTLSPEANESPAEAPRRLAMAADGPRCQNGHRRAPDGTLS